MQAARLAAVSRLQSHAIQPATAGRENPLTTTILQQPGLVAGVQVVRESETDWEGLLVWQYWANERTIHRQDFDNLPVMRFSKRLYTVGKAN